MAGKILSVPVSMVVHRGMTIINKVTGKWEKLPPGVYPGFKPTEGTTYLMVFAKFQSDLLATFEQHFGKHIIYKSKPFTNDAHGNTADDGARNTVVIWEL